MTFMGVYATFNNSANWQSQKITWFDDIAISNIQANQALMWDGPTAKWKNKFINTTGTLGGLDGGNIGSSPAPNYTTITMTVDSFYNSY